MREQILYYALKYKGEYPSIKTALKENKKWKKIDYDGNFITIFDGEYPEEFKNLNDPPFILFYKGDISLLKRNKIAITGTKKPLGIKDSISEFFNNINANDVIVGGLTQGVNEAIQREALHRGISNIAFLGTGIDCFYPQNLEFLQEDIGCKGLLLSEYPNGTAPLAHHFPWRKRLIVALCNELHVIQARDEYSEIIEAEDFLKSIKSVRIYKSAAHMETPYYDGYIKLHELIEKESQY